MLLITPTKKGKKYINTLSMDAVRSSIIICTHNRADMLQQTLPLVCRQESPGDKFEVIVIDNASTDRTRQVVNEVRDTFQFPIKYHFEPKIGLSYARNSGINLVEGEFVIFTDDDAIPQPGWLENIIKPFQNSSVMAVGGDVEPVWPDGEPPAWLSAGLQPYLGITRFYHKEDTDSYYPNLPFGVNIAFRKNAVRKAGGFSCDLGRNGNSLLSGEETELCIRLAKAGGKIVYTPGAVVKHIIARTRVSKQWFRKRSDIQGVSKAVIEFDGISSGRKSWLLLHRMAILAGSTFVFALCSLVGPERTAFQEECRMRMSWAYLCKGVKLFAGTGKA